MTDNSKKGLSPYSIRFTETERAELDRRASGRSLSTYIRACLFGEAANARKSRQVIVSVRDHKALSQVLAELGASHLANNLNQLAKAANLGTLDVSSKTEQELIDACARIRWMRETLIAALGLKSGGRS